MDVLVQLYFKCAGLAVGKTDSEKFALGNDLKVLLMCATCVCSLCSMLRNHKGPLTHSAHHFLFKMGLRASL